VEPKHNGIKVPKIAKIRRGFMFNTMLNILEEKYFN